MNRGIGVAGDPNELAGSADLAAESQIRSPREESSIPVRALYDVPEAMALLNLSRTQIYELIRTRRLITVTQGRRRLVPADSISEYVQLLLREAGGDDGRAALPRRGQLVLE
jgi:excisionase family DNA binding protein